CQQDYTYPLTF
nr:immunoglobulin light chain junction region [Macaca mulatta]MOV76422.1 immunoglobulin light chain junction region [Macaca mulatta]MOW11330.1 immunoglobulin light chain junction region [Macaca mulatta]